jgi:vacuolar protein sorting-associated protein 13A/C
MAAHAARSLITTLPYAIENHSGINASYSLYNDPIISDLPTSSTRFFRFELFPEKGSGGVRKYGQDIKHAKSLNIYIGSTKISIPDMDKEASKLRSVHYIAEMQTHVFTKVEKRGNSTVLHLSSHVELHNHSSLPFRIGIIGDETLHDLGVVESFLDDRKNSHHNKSKSLLKENENLMTHAVFGLPAPLLRSFAANSSETLCVQVSPVLGGYNDSGLLGLFNLPPIERLVAMASSPDEKRRIIEVTCTPASRGSHASSLTAHISFNVSLIDGNHAFIELLITPRAVLKNKLPVAVLVRTPMPHTFSPRGNHEQGEDPYYSTYKLNPLETLEVFTPGPSIAVSMKCADLPIGGTLTGWIDGEWLDIPLGKDRVLTEPVKCTFPYQSKSLDRYRSSRQLAVRGGGSDFYVLEAEDVTPDLKDSLHKQHTMASGDVRTVVFVVCAYVVDHTGNLLFEEVLLGGDQNMQRSSRSINSSSLIGSPPFSAYSSAKHRRRVSLLPGSSNLIRLASFTIDGDEGMQRSVPFRVEDVSMTEGIDSTLILWADGTPSGYFAYRHLTAEGSELHVVPEYVIYNGSAHHQICVRQISQPPFLLEPTKISPISKDKNNSIVVQFEIPAINGLTGPVQIDRVGLRVCVAKSKETGEPLGSLAVQTVTGARDSRLVIKIGALNFKEVSDGGRSSGLFAQDFIRCRVRWSEMRITLKDTEEESDKYDENREALRRYLEHHKVNSVELEKRLAEARRDYNVEVGKKRQAFPDVATILLHQFTVDFQRIFKENESKAQVLSLSSSERAQFSIVIHKIRVMDCSPNSDSPIVFDATSDKNFIDLCIRTRGPLSADYSGSLRCQSCLWRGKSRKNSHQYRRGLHLEDA